MASVGVLCARARVEEKALMAALAEAGIVSALFPPADEPLPVGSLAVAGHAFPVPQIVVDRHPDRGIARAVLATCRALQVPTLSAGIAATGDRLDVASALAAREVPRPPTALCTSQEAGLAAVQAMGLPATLLPLELQMPPIALLDVDAAEAVLEHRAVLGGADGALALLQAGSPSAPELATVLVVDGAAVALLAAPGACVTYQALRLAEVAARALEADLIAVTCTGDDEQPLVWDVKPVPELRYALPISRIPVATTIARAIARRLPESVGSDMPGSGEAVWVSIPAQEVRGDAVLST